MPECDLLITFNQHNFRMSNPYQEPTETLPIAKKGLTWAEWSIVVALLLILFAFLYAWSAKASATKAWKEAEVAKAELAKISGVSPEDVQKYINQINTLSTDAQRLRTDLSKWQNYANDLDRFVDAELGTYWTSKRNSNVPRPTKPR